MRGRTHDAAGAVTNVASELALTLRYNSALFKSMTFRGF